MEKLYFSFEIIPPKKGKNIQEIYNNIDPLMEFKPPFIAVTISREEWIVRSENNQNATMNFGYLCRHKAKV